MAANSRCRKMTEKIKMIVVKYLLLKMSVGVIRDKLQHKHSFVISRQGLYHFIRQWQSGKGLQRTRNVKDENVKLKTIHLKFMDMWLSHNNKLTTERFRRKLYEVFGLNVSTSLIRKWRSEFGCKAVVSKTCQLISNKSKQVCTTGLYTFKSRTIQIEVLLIRGILFKYESV